MKMVSIGDLELLFVDGYQHDDPLRESFNLLSREIFEFDFKDWYQNGYWGADYIPYSLIYEGRVVANVSVSLTDFIHLGAGRKCVQIGTVMTAPEFRGFGLCRYLIEFVVDYWTDRCEMLYLYANREARELYPKFGFREFVEYESYFLGNSLSIDSSFFKVDMDNSDVRRHFVSTLATARSVASPSLENKIGSTMFYCTKFLKDNVFYSFGFDAYVVVERNVGSITLLDIFSNRPLVIREIVSDLSFPGTSFVKLGFTPIDETGSSKRVRKSEETLFVLPRGDEILKGKFMFPSLSHS